MEIKREINEVYEMLEEALSKAKSLNGLEGQWTDSVSNAIKYIKLAKQSMEDIQ